MSKEQDIYAVQGPAQGVSNNYNQFDWSGLPRSRYLAPPKHQPHAGLRAATSVEFSPPPVRLRLAAKGVASFRPTWFALTAESGYLGFPSVVIVR